MKMKKNAKLLSEATVGDLTDRKCGFCGLNLQFAEADVAEKKPGCPVRRIWRSGNSPKTNTLLLQFPSNRPAMSRAMKRKCITR